MTYAQKREMLPSYARILLKFRLITKDLPSIQNAWHVWQLVCADHEVIRRSMALVSRSQPAYAASVAGPFKNGACVLAGMSDKQISELKDRIGLGKENPCR